MPLEQVQKRILPPANSTHPKPWLRRYWPSMPDPAIILPAPPEQVYLLMVARATRRGTIRRRIDLFCRAISDRAFATKYRQALLTVHRVSPQPELQRELPAGLPAPVELLRVAAACPDDHAGLRDRALFLLRAAGGLRPPALMTLDVEHICFAETAASLTIDTKRGVYRISIPCGTTPSLCPVQALRDWLHASGVQFGPVFRQISKAGKIGPHRLAKGAFRQIVRRRQKKVAAIA
jgi:site-specific recombinase XerC